jgi:hypothetical protein
MNEFFQKSALAIAIVGLSLGAVFAATNSIAIPDIEFGSGAKVTPACLSTSLVDYGTSIQGNLSQVTVSNIGSDCAGLWVRISLYTSADGSGAPIEQVVWQLPSVLDAEASYFTTSANDSELADVNVATIYSFLLEVSDTVLQDGPAAP